MKLKLLFAIAFSLILASRMTSQVSAYSFSQSFTPYGPAFTGTNYIGAYFQDDDFNTFSLPFTFTFNGTPYNSVEIHSNGYLTFVGAMTTVYLPISDPATSEVASGMGQDLMTGTVRTGDIAMGSNVITNVSFTGGLSVGDSIEDFNGDFGIPYPIITNVSANSLTLNTTAIVTSSAYDFYVANGAIRTQVAGTAPNRTLTIEYRNFMRFGIYDEYMNFKFRLHETINKIEVCYGAATPGNDPTQNGFEFTYAEIGLKGSSTSDFNSRRVPQATPYIASQTSTIVTDSCVYNPSRYPTGGVTYGWQPPCDVPTFTVAQSSPTICTGQSATLTASGANTYSFISVGGQSVQVVTPSVTTNYTVVGRQGLCSTTLNVLQVVEVYPTVTIAGTTTVCSGKSATLTANGAQSYSWTGQGSGAQVVLTPTANTIYTVTGANGSCTSSLTTTVNVTALPNVQVASSNTLPCQNTQFNLTASGATTYSWNTGAGTAMISVTQATTTTYTVTGTSNGCSKQLIHTQNVKICQGIAENGKVTFAVYPNPFTDSFRLQSASGSLMQVSVYDITGKMIFAAESSAELQINAQYWNKGVYIVRVADANGSSTGKLIKE